MKFELITQNGIKYILYNKKKIPLISGRASNSALVGPDGGLVGPSGGLVGPQAAAAEEQQFKRRIIIAL
jgi:hypothetical protein